MAKRHPELAEHLSDFRHRSNSREKAPDSREFRSRFGRPLDRFGFGFPFDREEFDPEAYAQQFYRPREEFYHQEPSHNGSTSSYKEQPVHHPQEQPAYHHSETQYQPSQSETVPEAHSTSEASGKERSNLQQSNTTDLGQRQEPVNDRNQRSMSAPPADKGQRFTSTASTQSPSQSENMSQPETKSNERIIPIHIEGRDEPVLPKNVPPSYSQPHHHQTFTPQHNERIFGQRPEHFTQFLHREPRQYTPDDFFAEEPVRQQRFQQQHTAPPHYAAPQKEEIPIPVQRVHQPRQQEHQQQKRTASPHPPQPQTQPRQETPPPKPAPPQQQSKSLSPIEQIQAIQKEVSNLMGRVEKFAGKPKDKEYLYLDEMLTRNLLKLDNIDTQGQENIRSARKEAVRCIEKTISVLEAKAAANVAPPKPEENMEVEERPQESDLETPKESDIETKSEQTMEAQPIEEQKPEETVTEQQMETESEIKPQPTECTETMELVPESPANKLESQEDVKSESAGDKVEVVEQTPESNKAEICDGQESNMSVADAVKMFSQEKSDEKNNVSTASEEQKNENSTENSEVNTEEKKEKKKGKKKVDKQEK